MPVRNWLYHPPVGVLVVVIILLAITGLQNRYGGAQSSQGTASIENQQAQFLTERCDADCKAERSEQRADDDLKAQQDMAWYAALLFVVSFAAVILLAATLYETRNAGRSAAEILTQTKRQADIADDTARRELRAYLSVEPRGVNWLTMSSRVIGHVLIRNVGHLPAKRVATLVRMTVSDSRLFSEIEIGEDKASGSRVMQPSVEIRQGSRDAPPIMRATTVMPGKYFYVWGVVYYDDGYGCTRFTSFCHRYDAASRNDSTPELSMHGTRYRGSLIDADKARYHEKGNDAD